MLSPTGNNGTSIATSTTTCCQVSLQRATLDMRGGYIDMWCAKIHAAHQGSQQRQLQRASQADLETACHGRRIELAKAVQRNLKIAQAYPYRLDQIASPRGGRHRATGAHEERIVERFTQSPEGMTDGPAASD